MDKACKNVDLSTLSTDCANFLLQYSLIKSPINKLAIKQETHHVANGESYLIANTPPRDNGRRYSVLIIYSSRGP